MTVSEMPLVSIALCTYNGQKHLEEQLNSLVNQSYPRIEIIIVDDVSTDGTMDILAKYQKSHSFIKVHQNEANLGYIKNFEKAMSLCKGEYISLCDQDDIWHKNKIERLVENIGTALLIYHDSELIKENGESLNTYFSDKLRFFKGAGVESFLLLNCVSGHAMMFSRKVLDRVQTIPDGLFHDWWLVFAASAMGAVTYIKEPLVYYRQHAANATDFFGTKNSINAVENHRNVVKRLTLFANAHFLSGQQKRKITLLLNNYKKKERGPYSVSLLFYLLCHLSLFNLANKSIISKLNLARRTARGINLKGHTV